MEMVTKGTAALGIFQRDRAAVHGDNFLAHGKADAAAARFGTALVKFHFDVRQLLFGDAGTVVADAHHDLPVFQTD